MYLLLNDGVDPLCDAVRAALEREGRHVRVIGNPLLGPSAFAWRFDTDNSESRLTWDDGKSLPDREVEGVLVRASAKLAAEGWDPADLAYMRKETDAALLAWLWSLDCLVINRYPAALWYRANLPLPCWLSLLERNGLRGLPWLISNVEEETRAFAAKVDKRTVYAPLTAEARYPLDTDDLWKGIAAMQRLGPVCLTQALANSQLACVVGRRIVWDGVAPGSAYELESALIRFSTAARLPFVEITVASGEGGSFVAAVDPRPCFEHFDETAQTRMVSGLVELFTKEPAGASEIGQPLLPRLEGRF